MTHIGIDPAAAGEDRTVIVEVKRFGPWIRTETGIHMFKPKPITETNINQAAIDFRNIPAYRPKRGVLGYGSTRDRRSTAIIRGHFDQMKHKTEQIIEKLWIRLTSALLHTGIIKQSSWKDAIISFATRSVRSIKPADHKATHTY